MVQPIWKSLLAFSCLFITLGSYTEAAGCNNYTNLEDCSGEITQPVRWLLYKIGITSSSLYDNVTLISLFEEALGITTSEIVNKFNLSNSQNDSIHNNISTARNSFSPALSIEEVTDLQTSYFVLSYVYEDDTISSQDIAGQASLSNAFYQKNITFSEYLNMFGTNITSNFYKTLLNVVNEIQGLDENSFKEIHTINSTSDVDIMINRFQDIGIEFQKTSITELVAVASKIENFHIPVIMLGLNNGVERNDFMVKTILDVIKYATSLTDDHIYKMFNITTSDASLDISSILNGFSADFAEGYYSNYLSLGFVLPKYLVRSGGNASLNNENYLEGVTYVQKNVILNDLLRIYQRPDEDLMGDTIMELISLMHGVNASQVKSIHNLTLSQVNGIQTVTFQQLFVIGVVVNELTLMKIFMLAANLENFHIPVVMLGLNNGIEKVFLGKPMLDVIELATGLMQDDVFKVFNLTDQKATFDLSSVLNAFSGDFEEGYYNNYLSLGFILPEFIRNSVGSAALNYVNYLEGVTYMQRNVLLKDLLRIYARSDSDLMNDNIAEFANLIHGTNSTQLKDIHNLTSAQMLFIESIKFKEIQSVGVALKDATLEELLTVATYIGNR